MKKLILCLFTMLLTIPSLLSQDISTATNDGVFLALGSGGRAFTFKPDGTQMYATYDNGSGLVRQYTLSTPWSLPSASNTQNLTTVATFAGGIDFNSDGTILLLHSTGTDRVVEYLLSTPWDVSTGTYVRDVVLTGTAFAWGLDLMPDDKTFVTTSDVGNQLYEAAAPNDFSSVTKIQNINNGTISATWNVEVSIDGQKIFYTGNSGQVNEIVLATPFDLANQGAETLVSLPGISQPVYDIYFVPSQNKMFIQAQSFIQQFSMTFDLLDDIDGDGVFVGTDCDDNNPLIGAKQTPGTACDDGNSSTENDQIQSDSCTCAGTASLLRSVIYKDTSAEKYYIIKDGVPEEVLQFDSSTTDSRILANESLAKAARTLIHSTAETFANEILANGDSVFVRSIFVPTIPNVTAHTETTFFPNITSQIKHVEGAFQENGTSEFYGFGGSVMKTPSAYIISKKSGTSFSITNFWGTSIDNVDVRVYYIR